jgi:hypothetical protein
MKIEYIGTIWVIGAAIIVMTVFEEGVDHTVLGFSLLGLLTWIVVKLIPEDDE